MNGHRGFLALVGDAVLTGPTTRQWGITVPRWSSRNPYADAVIQCRAALPWRAYWQAAVARRAGQRPITNARLSST